MDPYADSIDHLLDELQRLDLLLRDHVETWQSATGTLEEFRGLYVSDERVVDLLNRTPTHDGDGDRGQARRIGQLTRTIRKRERLSAEAGRSLRLSALAARFELSPRHVDALLVCLAPEVDGKYETIYAYLQDDTTRRRPTVGFVLDLLSTGAADRCAVRDLFAPSSPLVRHGLVHLAPGEGDSLRSRFVDIDGRIVDYLHERDPLDPRIHDVTTVVTPDRNLADLVVNPALRERLDALVTVRSTRPSVHYFHGPYGVGKAAAVDAVCQARDLSLLCVDGTSIDDADAVLTRVRREAALRDATVHVSGVESLCDGDGPAVETVIRLLNGVDVVFLTSETSWTPRRGAGDRTHHVVSFPRPTFGERRALWEAHAETLPDDTKPTDLATKFRLTAGQVADALVTARALAHGEELTREAVYRACRAQVGETLGELARKVDPVYSWDDIVLPADRLTQLREVAARVRHQGTVYADWGFDETFSLGSGLNVLFTGASGTGKTMAAEILARDADVDLYKIDLSSVVSKYIGETEKNLNEIFEAAEHSNALLLFDEADALFGKRSEVTDAHDRYANIEVNYLLQRVEEHDGTVILTTNFEGNIDHAFLRRIHATVDFPLPDRASRERIWRRIFPEATPCGELDYAFLAGLDLAGGNIKNVALTAAFLAADDGGTVEMSHVVRGVRREFEKTGKLLAPEEFGDYRDSLTG